MWYQAFGEYSAYLDYQSGDGHEKNCVVHRVDLTFVVPIFVLGNVKMLSQYSSFRIPETENVAGIRSRGSKYILHSQYPGCYTD